MNDFNAGSSPRGRIHAGTGRTFLVAALGCSAACSSWPDPDLAEQMDGSSRSIIDAALGPTVSTTSFVLSAAGGHFELGLGVTLDVFPGTVSSDTLIDVTLTLEKTASTTGVPSNLLALIEMSNAGAGFTRSATLTVPLPSGVAPHVAASLLEDAVPTADLGDALDGGVDEQEDPATGVPLLSVVAPDGSFLQVPIQPYGVGQLTAAGNADVDGKGAITGALSAPAVSTFAVARTASSATTLAELVTASTPIPRHQSTGCIAASQNTEPLSQQILAVWRSQHPELGLSQITSNPPKFSPYLTAAAISDLAMAGSLQINAAWRSLATQFVVSQTCSPAAKIGTSNHGPGEAVDIQLLNPDHSPLSKETAAGRCNALLQSMPSIAPSQVMDFVVPELGETLLRAHWVWWGLFTRDRIFTTKDGTTSHSMCSDPVHFEHRGLGPTFPLLDGDQQSLNVQQVEAFKRLWNYNNPCAQLTEAPHTPLRAPSTPVNPDAVAQDLFTALSRAPSGGFDEVPPLGATADATAQPPPAGSSHMGCAMAEQPAVSVCCPKDKQHDRPWCSNDWTRSNPCSSCGDGTCDTPEETASSCPQDCGTSCGDAVLDADEECCDFLGRAGSVPEGVARRDVPDRYTPCPIGMCRACPDQVSAMLESECGSPSYVTYGSYDYPYLAANLRFCSADCSDLLPFGWCGTSSSSSSGSGDLGTTDPSAIP